MAFDSYGRRCGLQALLRGHREGFAMLLTPVSIVRYWEFPFVLRQLPSGARTALDVASPRLFSYYALTRGAISSVRMINPDGRDARVTMELARLLHVPRLTVDELTIAQTRGEPDLYDAAWSISVVEHIAGDGDMEAVALMWQAVRPGGRLILTVPTDRNAWDEYRDRDEYQLGAASDQRGYFFQRWYDEAAIRTRLLSQLDGSSSIEWFGEKRPGHFARYELAWMAEGYARTVADPREIADHYTRYQDWASMPGQGVAGIVVEKPE